MNEVMPPPPSGHSNKQKKNIFHVFIGTKAQYIKTAPLLRLMQESGCDYNLIDSGQHAAFSPKLRKELGIKEPDFILESKGNIKTVKEALLWFLKYLSFGIFRRKFVQGEIFQGKKGICIVHGDTPSTLLALILAQRAGLKVAHIEAGLRSYNLLKPFPEEIIRIICMRRSDYLFTPSRWAHDNLIRMKVDGEIHDVEQNSNVEAMYYSLAKNSDVPSVNKKYCMITIHRVETILSKKRVMSIIGRIESISKWLHVVFIMHDPTRKKLEEYRSLDRIKNNSDISSYELMPHNHFLSLLTHAEFIITDGGSIQEESCYLDVPCLVMRSETERQEGIGENVMINGFDQSIFDVFIAGYGQMKKGKRVENMHPSQKMYDILAKEMQALNAEFAD